MVAVRRIYVDLDDVLSLTTGPLAALLEARRGWSEVTARFPSP